MTFLDLAEKVLTESKIPLSANELWEIAVKKGYDKLLNSKGKTPWATLGARVYVEVKENKKSIFEVIGDRPKKFVLKGKNYESIIEIQEQIEQVTTKKKIEYLEKDLHPFLSYFAYYHLNCYTKTINHLQSKKNEFGEWVHPDMVGCYFSLEEWKPEVFELSSAIGNISSKLLSFEIKKKLSFSNLRESFFQSVSNSSWANESYLVAAEISNETDFMNELSRLSTSFGIGVIKLNIEEPNSSEIILPAKYRENLDWDTINKLTMNSDFKEFLKRVKNDIQSKEIRKEKYDKIYDEKELIKMIKKVKK